MDLQARWNVLVALPEDEFPLDQAALLIAAHANPTLDLDGQLQRLDALAARVDAPTSQAACELLFGQEGLRGDRSTYEDPRNSYLDQVLERRLGIPISLSVVLLEVGRRIGVPLEGVGMPGHFLVRDRSDPERLIDAFSGGRRLTHGACQELLRAAAGATARLTPAMLAPTGPLAIVQRMLNNLDHSFRQRHDLHSLAWVTRLRVTTPGLGLGARADLAAQLDELGFPGEAAAVYDELAAFPGLDAEVAQRLRDRATSARAILN